MAGLTKKEKRDLELILKELSRSEKEHQKTAEAYSDLQSLWSELSVSAREKSFDTPSKTTMVTKAKSEKNINRTSTNQKIVLPKLTKSAVETNLQSQTTSSETMDKNKRTANPTLLKRLRHQRELFENMKRFSENDVSYRVNFLSSLDKNNLEYLKSFEKEFPEFSDLRCLMDVEK